jgi:GH25 family lysozyme M1 (1,4-beta-N-acetylmuramidase)
MQGIDISSWQGKPEFIRLQNEIDFIIIKATEGVGYKDKEFYRNQNEARAVNLPLGYYHFARPDLGNSPTNEAEYFISVIGKLEIGEILVLDYEVNSYNGVSWCKKFLDHVTKITNTKPLIYLNQYQIQNMNWESVIQGNYGLWVASYDNDQNNVNFSTGWPVVAMKQYTNSGVVQGIYSRVDMNTFFGSREMFRKYGYQTDIDPDKEKIEKLKIAIDRVKSELDASMANINIDHKSLYKETIDKLNKIVITGSL